MTPAPAQASVFEVEAQPRVFWIGILAALAAGLILTPILARIWRAFGKEDREVSLRKVHDGDTPRVGGIVILVAVVSVAAWGLSGSTELSRTHRILSVSPISGVLLGALIVGVVGLIDDVWGVRARYKLLAQLVAAGLAIAFGLRWPALEMLLDRNIVSMVLTAAFLVAAVNAINLMDGLDGLAGGVLTCILTVVILSAFLHGSAEMTAIGWLAATATGSLLAFLVYNRNPAKVFMGDSGAYFLGFLAAGLLLFIEPVRPRKPMSNLGIPLLALALPFMDVGLAIARRALRGQPIFGGDADHIHHRLLARGRSVRGVVRILWATGATFCLLSYLTVRGVSGQWTLLGALGLVAALSGILGYHKVFAEAGLLSPAARTKRAQYSRLVHQLEILARETQAQRDPQALEHLLGDSLGHLGAKAIQIRRGEEVTVEVGEMGDHPGVCLSFPVPGEEGRELRLMMSTASVARMLPPERQMLLERVLGACGEASQR